MSKVNHPNHYNIPGKKECIVEMREQFGCANTAVFCLMSAYKYLYRAGNKENESEKDDIDKAEWYFCYVRDHIFSTVRGSKRVKLYNYIYDVLKGLGRLK